MIGRVRNQATVRAYRAGETISTMVPWRVGLGVGQLLGRTAALASPERRLMVERNLARVYGPELRGPRRARKVAQTFDSYARYYFDSFRLPRMSVEQVAAGIVVDGVEHLDEAMAHDPVGPVLALPHLGGWEWAAAWITRVRGWGLAAVVEELEPPELFEWFLEFRRSLGMNIIPLGPDAAAGVVAAALERQVVCLLCDRDIAGNGIEVEFLGERTTLPAGPAVLALRTGCRLLPTAVYFEQGDGVRGLVRPPIDTTRQGTLREDVTRVTQALADELEVLIRRAPEQWHLMTPNWPSDVDAVAKARRLVPTIGSHS